MISVTPTGFIIKLSHIHMWHCDTYILSLLEARVLVNGDHDRTSILIVAVTVFYMIDYDYYDVLTLLILNIVSKTNNFTLNCRNVMV